MRGFSRAWLAPSLLALATACAKTGDPHPPVFHVPKPAADLEVRQYDSAALLSFSVPAVNTDGSPVTALGSVELFRLAEPRGGPSGPLAEEDFLRRAERIVEVRAADLERYTRGGRVVLRDELRFPDPVARFQNTFRYAARFVNRAGQTAGLGNQLLFSPVPVPEPPAAISFELAQEYVRLRWTAAPPAAGYREAPIVGYNVYRAEEGQDFSPAPRNKEPVQGTEFEDREFEFDKTYRYAVSVVASAASPNAESHASQPATVTTKDVFAPAAPENLQAVAEGGVVFLFWSAPADRDVAGYRVYRRREGAGEFERLEAELVAALSYRDARAAAGARYEYRVSAVDRYGNEGPAASAVAQVPQIR